MKRTGICLILTVSVAAFRIAPEVPKPRANESVYDGLKRKLFSHPENCEQNARELLSGVEGILSEKQTSRIRGIFSNGERHNKLSFLLVGTKHSICMADNWFVNAVHATTQPSLFVYVALDEESYSSCVKEFQPRAGWGKEKHTIECADMSDVLPWSSMTSPNVIGFGSCIYKFIVWMKPLFLKVATSSVKDPSSVLLIDTDIILHRDLHELLSEGRTSSFQTGDDDGRGNPNTGLVSINSNADELLHMWLKQAPIYFEKDTADQFGLFKLLNSPEGQHFKENMHLIPNSQFGMCAVRGQYATHYNCVSEKDLRMQLDGIYRPATPVCMDKQAEMMQKIEEYNSHNSEPLKKVKKSTSIFDQEFEKMLQTS